MIFFVSARTLVRSSRNSRTYRLLAGSSSAPSLFLTIRCFCSISSAIWSTPCPSRQSRHCQVLATSAAAGDRALSPLEHSQVLSRRRRLRRSDVVPRTEGGRLSLRDSPQGQRRVGTANRALTEASVEQLEPDGPWKISKNSLAISAGGWTQRVKMGDIPSLERFQAQVIWEVSGKPNLMSCNP